MTLLMHFSAADKRSGFSSPKEVSEGLFPLLLDVDFSGEKC